MRVFFCYCLPCHGVELRGVRSDPRALAKRKKAVSIYILPCVVVGLLGDIRIHTLPAKANSLLGTAVLFSS